MNTTISSRYWKSEQYQDDIGKVKYDNSIISGNGINMISDVR